MRGGSQVPQLLTAIVMSDLNGSRDFHEHWAEYDPAPCSLHRCSKLYTWLHQKHGQVTKEVLSLSLITAGEAAPATLSVALGPPLQQGQGNRQGYDIRAGELDL